jgi:hypothetical protein
MAHMYVQHISIIIHFLLSTLLPFSCPPLAPSLHYWCVVNSIKGIVQWQWTGVEGDDLLTVLEKIRSSGAWIYWIVVWWRYQEIYVKSWKAAVVEADRTWTFCQPSHMAKCIMEYSREGKKRSILKYFFQLYGSRDGHIITNIAWNNRYYS